MKILGVIPARAGSKGVPQKNKRLLNKEPLIVHTINTALASHAFDKVLVTTDSEEIRDIALAAGAEVPFLRDPLLATDGALAIPVIQDATRRAIEYFGYEFDAICMLQPTTPLRSAKDCENICKILAEDAKLDAVISVVKVSQHPYKMMRQSDEGLLIPFLDWPVENPPRQSLPKVFIYNGAFYLTRSNVLLNEGSFRGNKCFLYEMPDTRSVNIDNEIDLKLAENILRQL